MEASELLEQIKILTETMESREEEVNKLSYIQLAILNNASDAIWLMDMEFNILYANPAMCKTRGISEEELKSTPIRQRISEESFAKVESLAKEHFTAENFFNRNKIIEFATEVEIERKSGRKYVEETCLTVIRDSKGHPQWIVGVGRDITERKQQVEKLKAVFDQSPFAIGIFDENGSLLEVNSKTYEVFGIIEPTEIDKFNYFSENNFPPKMLQEIKLGGKVEVLIPFDFSKVSYKTTKTGIRMLRITASKISLNGYGQRIISYVTDLTPGE